MATETPLLTSKRTRICNTVFEGGTNMEDKSLRNGMANEDIMRYNSLHNCHLHLFLRNLLGLSDRNHLACWYANTNNKFAWLFTDFQRCKCSNFLVHFFFQFCYSGIASTLPLENRIRIEQSAVGAIAKINTDTSAAECNFWVPEPSSALHL